LPFCPKCGTENDEDAEYCKKCGTALKVRPQNQAPPPLTRQEIREARREARYSRRGERIGGAFIGGGILIAIGVFLYLQTIGYNVDPYLGAAILIVVGAAIVVGALLRSGRF
jgi:uncharacterized membrane protein YvbJ